MDSWSELLTVFNSPTGGGAVMFAFGLFALTGRIVWHTKVEEANARADKWETLALGLLQTTTKATDAAAQVVTAALPEAAAEEGGGGL